MGIIPVCCCCLAVKELVLSHETLYHTSSLLTTLQFLCAPVNLLFSTQNREWDMILPTFLVIPDSVMYTFGRINKKQLTCVGRWSNWFFFSDPSLLILNIMKKSLQFLCISESGFACLEWGLEFQRQRKGM